MFFQFSALNLFIYGMTYSHPSPVTSCTYLPSTTTRTFSFHPLLSTPLKSASKVDVKFSSIFITPHPTLPRWTPFSALQFAGFQALDFSACSSLHGDPLLQWGPAGRVREGTLLIRLWTQHKSRNSPLRINNLKSPHQHTVRRSFHFSHLPHPKPYTNPHPYAQITKARHRTRTTHHTSNRNPKNTR